MVVFGHLISLFFVIGQGCAQPAHPEEGLAVQITPGAWATDAYLPLLKDKKVGLVVNHTSTIGNTHLVDSLIQRGVKIETLFAPEHGFRGQADAGTHIKDGIDSITGVRIISLYGDKKKPAQHDMEGIDVMVFDIQDVGVRFYTYISTLHYIMEACADLGIPLIVLDRPNPNGHYVDGPVLDTARFRSFVGMHPVPVVYGMTIGELAKMIRGEKWIHNQCELTVIPCRNYDHSMMYELPLRPSPNLPDLRSVLLYPGICFFEGTPLSLGRGTLAPFQLIGSPDYPDHSFSFMPKAMEGAMNPPLKDRVCFGKNISNTDLDSLFRQRKMDLSMLLHFYGKMDKTSFFNTSWFDKLAGTSALREAIQAGMNEDQIRNSWKEELARFNARRRLYLLYRDF